MIENLALISDSGIEAFLDLERSGGSLHKESCVDTTASIIKIMNLQYFELSRIISRF